MAGKMDRILFVSHEASRRGAPVLLLEVIREFKRQTGQPVKIILRERGVLEKEFRALGKTYMWLPARTQFGGLSILSPILGFFSKVWGRIKRGWILYQIRKTRITFFNTITNGNLHGKLLFLKSKSITYVHELEMVIQDCTHPSQLAQVLNHTDLFLTGSQAVKDNLIKNHAVPEYKARVIYSAIPEVDRQRAAFLQKTCDTKKALGIGDQSIVFGIAGEMEWRKGFDLFSPLVKLYFDVYPDSNAHFIWIGMRTDSPNYKKNMDDFGKYAIGKRVSFLPHGGTTYLEYMALLDVHLLLSREDPFPLVVLDAASFSSPTICFENAGGAPEFVSRDAGICIPYGDLMRLAKAIRKLEEDGGLRQALGMNAAKKLAKEFSQSATTAKIIDLINEI